MMVFLAVDIELIVSKRLSIMWGLFQVLTRNTSPAVFSITQEVSGPKDHKSRSSKRTCSNYSNRCRI